jgi:hypothetical protein
VQKDAPRDTAALLLHPHKGVGMQVKTSAHAAVIQPTDFVTAKIMILKNEHHYSKEKVETPFLSSISRTMPPPRATQVSGSSAI